MKTNYLLTALALAALAAAGVWSTHAGFLDPLNPVLPMRPNFTYQGQLQDASGPVSGLYDFRFAMFDAWNGPTQIGPTVTNSALLVSNGLFTAGINFGSGMFDGSDRWIEISVRPSGSAADFTKLSPRQLLMATPYALYAANAGYAILATNLIGVLPGSQLGGTYTNALTFSNPGNSFTGNGTGLSNVNAATLNGLAASAFWKLGGNSNTTPGVNFLGTLDDQPLEIKVNGLRALRLEGSDPYGYESPNVIGGYHGNGTLLPGLAGVAIAGGGMEDERNQVGGNFTAVGGGIGNNIGVGTDYSTIAGGRGNIIQDTNVAASIGGGLFNQTEMNADQATIGGGSFNTIQRQATNATIAGGRNNTIQTNATFAAIGGGRGNTIQTNALYSSIGGGFSNKIGTAVFATIPGGYNNVIQFNGAASTIGGGFSNTIGTAWYVTIPGGYNNIIQANADASTIGGGFTNRIGSARYATVAGGQGNTIETNANYAAIGGGGFNLIRTNAYSSTIGGGAYNTIRNNAYYATIAGGLFNIAAGESSYIAGGVSNLAAGIHSFAAGYRAKAQLNGSFVWADGTSYDYDPFSYATPGGIANSFNARARGGVYFVTEIDTSGVPTAGLYVSSGGSGWNAYSDRNAKTNLVAVSGREILNRLAAIPLSSWNYKTQDPSIRHIGPMAQDFNAAFDVGERDKAGEKKHINSLDVDGVALAAIQGLNDIVKEKDAEIKALQESVAELKALVNQMVQKRNGGEQ